MGVCLAEGLRRGLNCGKVNLSNHFEFDDSIVILCANLFAWSSYGALNNDLQDQIFVKY